MNNVSLIRLAAGLLSFFLATATLAQTAPPPTLGQETKGEPAIEEAVTETDSEGNSQDAATQDSGEPKQAGPLGTATIKESRRESGQVYLIELKHSAGAPQYIEETDSDGNIESEATDIEDTPNLAKWRLGSW